MQNKDNNIFIRIASLTILTVIAICLVVISIGNTDRNVGTFNTRGGTEQGTYRLYNAFVATTTTASSTPINISGAKKVTLFLSRGDTTGQGNSGSSVFSVTVSGDDSTYFQFNKLIDNVASTNAQTITRVATVTLPAGTSTKVYSLDLGTDGFTGMKCGIIETTDGEHTCKVLVQY